MLVSPVVRTVAVKVMLPFDGVVAIVAPKGRTEYVAEWMPIGRSDSDAGGVPVYGP